MSNTDDLVTTAGACELLGLDRSTLTRLVKDGRLRPALKLPGRTGALLFRRSEVEVMAQKRVKAAERALEEARRIAAAIPTARSA